MNEFSVGLFQQVLDVILDPRFKSSEVTFKNAWGIFDCVSTYRKSMALSRTLAKPHKAERTSGVVPPVVLGLIVDTFVQQMAPVGPDSGQMNWFEMFEFDGDDLRNMCLVHRSWTDIAQKGLRRRAIIPYQQINRFLLSPLCGPWITEMAIYWTLEPDDKVGVDDLDLVKALFARTPNVHCLAFNTGLLVIYGSSHILDLKVEVCLNTIASALPHLRELWLKHFNYELGSEPLESAGYDAWQSLYACLPRMHSLELLSVNGWKCSEIDLDWNKCPPQSLKTMELGLVHGVSEHLYAGLLRPRGNFCLRSLSIWGAAVFWENSYQQLLLSLQSCVRQLEHLSWLFQHDYASAFDDLLRNCYELTSLEIFYDQGLRHHTVPRLPQSLVHLTIHYHEKYLYKAHSSGLQFILSLVQALSMLSRLQSLLFITYTGESMVDTRSMFYDGHDSRVYCQLEGATTLAGEALPEDLVKFCKDRRIHLACVNSFQLVIPNGSNDSDSNDNDSSD